MFFILHGDDTASSRNKLQTILEPFEVIERFNGKESTFETLFKAASSSNLFFEKKALVIENYSLLKKVDIELFNSQLAGLIVENLTIIIWERKKLTASILKKLPKENIMEFSLPSFYFAFLDGLKPTNDHKTRELLYKVAKHQEVEQLLYSIIKRIRYLALLKEGRDGVVDETKNASTWQKNKLLQQSRYWNSQELNLFYEKLFEIEKKLKTSSLALPLLSHIDILLFTKTIKRHF